MTTTVQTQPWGMFRVRLTRHERLSPSMLRLTFSDPSLADFADNGYDQRIKVVLAQRGGWPLDEFPTDPEWFTAWREQPTQQRAQIRRYTARGVRHDVGEIDLDFVDHGVVGPGSRFAVEADFGDEVILVGPSAAYDGDHGGLEFRRDLAGATRQLIVGDLTALPAIAGIVSELPSSATGLVSVTVPSADDAQDLRAPEGVTVQWCTDGDQAQQDAVRAWLDSLGPLHGDGAETYVLDEDDDAYWEVSTAGQQTDVPAVSAWIAAESSQVRALRRMLVSEYDVPRAAVAFMGYWREGVAGS